MSAYLVVRVDVKNPDLYKAYTARSPKVVQKFGGKFLVRGGACTTLEGEEFNGRLVVIEFPDSRSARGFYDSREYQDLVRLRAPAACAEFVLAEGFPPTP